MIQINTVFREAQGRGSNPGQRWREAAKFHWGEVHLSSMVPTVFSVSSPVLGACVESGNK